MSPCGIGVLTDSQLAGHINPFSWHGIGSGISPRTWNPKFHVMRDRAILRAKLQPFAGGWGLTNNSGRYRTIETYI
jgi:hypothetical protein